MLYYVVIHDSVTSAEHVMAETWHRFSKVKQKTTKQQISWRISWRAGESFLSGDAESHRKSPRSPTLQKRESKTRLCRFCVHFESAFDIFNPLRYRIAVLFCFYQKRGFDFDASWDPVRSGSNRWMTPLILCRGNQWPRSLGSFISRQWTF